MNRKTKKYYLHSAVCFYTYLDTRVEPKRRKGSGVSRSLSALGDVVRGSESDTDFGCQLQCQDDFIVGQSSQHRGFVIIGDHVEIIPLHVHITATAIRVGLAKHFRLDGYAIAAILAIGVGDVARNQAHKGDEGTGTIVEEAVQSDPPAEVKETVLKPSSPILLMVSL